MAPGGQHSGRSTGGQDTEVPARLPPRPHPPPAGVSGLCSPSQNHALQVSLLFRHSAVPDSATPWAAARQASLPLTTSRRLLKPMTTSSSVTRFSPIPDISSVKVFSNDWDVNHRNMSSHRCGGCKAKIRRPAGWGAGEASSCFADASLSGCPHGVEGRSPRLPVRPPAVTSGPRLTTSVNLNYLLNDFAVGLGASPLNLKGDSLIRSRWCMPRSETAFCRSG